jgi:hypothetical protein
MELQQPHVVQLDFHGVKVNVYTNSPYIVDHLGIGYGYFETSVNREPDFSLLVLESGIDPYDKMVKRLFPDRNYNDHVLISTDLELVFFLRDHPLLAFYTVKLLFGQLIELLNESYLGLHAAALSFKDCGILLCGAARCGKTVLTSLLIEQGFRYLSDDVTMVHRKRLSVVPFPRALNIREEYEDIAGSLLKKARNIVEYKIADQERLLVDLSDFTAGDVKPDLVVFPSFEEGKAQEFSSLSQSNALIMLMRQRFHPLCGSLEDSDEEDFGVVGEMLDDMSCFRILYSDPVKAAQTIKSTVEEAMKCQ